MNLRDQHPGLSELDAVIPDVMNEVVNAVFGLFRGYRFCFPVAFNVKRIKVLSRFADGTAKTGSMEWAIAVQPHEGDYTMTAYIDIDWTGELVRVPAIFRDHQGNHRGFSEVSLKRFLYAGADLSESVSVMRPR